MIRLKSARQALPSWSIKMLAFGLGKLKCREQLWNLNTYPLKVPVDDSLPMHIDQPPGDVSQLRQPHKMSVVKENRDLEWKPYKFQPVCICVGLHESIDATIYHPL